MTRMQRVACICGLLLLDSASSTAQARTDSLTIIRAGRLFDSERGVFLSARDISRPGECH